MFWTLEIPFMTGFAVIGKETALRPDLIMVVNIWNLTPNSSIDKSQRFAGTCSLHHLP
jgi:hypothetical protein